MKGAKVGSVSLFFLIAVAVPLLGHAQEQSAPATSRNIPVDITLMPLSASFVEGSTFEVPVLLNTRGANVSSIELRVSFDPEELAIVRPAGGQSIIGIWVEPPKYDNTRGTASYVGYVPNGITTDAGLIASITFHARQTGSAVVSVEASSNVLLNDSVGTAAALNRGRAEYIIIPKPAAGVAVYSETHPLQSQWYNNNSPVLYWERGDYTAWSYVLDTEPFTVPPNSASASSTSASFSELADGLWYFHIKAEEKGAWGPPGHFLIRIDTTPPQEFKPEVEYLTAAAILSSRVLVSAFTTDNLSGVDHYEVGVLDKNMSTTESPAFVRAEGPFHVSLQEGKDLRVIMRAFDKAGNVRDASTDVSDSYLKTAQQQTILMGLLAMAALLLVGGFIGRYLFGHHLLRQFRRVLALMRLQSEEEHEREAAIRKDTPPLS